MNNATGPKYSVEITQQTIEGANFVQEELVIIGTTPDPSYALLGYIPVEPRSVKIYLNGKILIQGVDYQIDDRKIAFTASLAESDTIYADYITSADVASIPAVTIDFDIPGQNVRISSSGSLQLFIDNAWYDMKPVRDPISGLIQFVPDQTPSLNQ